MSYNPFREIVRRFSESRSITQPVPDVTEKDVLRIVQRDYPGQFDSVMDTLNGYGTEKWEREKDRVRLAVLKLGDGRIDKLTRVVEDAKRDYRNILAASEYPEYSRWRGLGVTDISRREKERIIKADWTQYEAWLRK